MFDRLTESGDRALALARDEARRLGHPCLGTEHLLLGVLGADDGVGAEILTQLGLTLDDARAHVVALGPEEKPETLRARSTALAMDVLTLAWWEARSRDEIGSEHILLALLRKQDGVGALVLSRADIGEAQVRVELARLRGQDAPQAPEPREQPGPSAMYERFTDRGRRVVAFALEEARTLGHDSIGTEHLLLGLLREEDAIAALVLTSLGVTADRVRAQVIAGVDDGEEAPSGQIPFSPTTTKALELALREALLLGHGYIATEHILLGLVRGGESVANQVLFDLGADPGAVCNEVLRVLSGPGHGPKEGA